jgi:WD40 repeat protein
MTAIGDSIGMLRIISNDDGMVKFEGQLLGGPINELCWSSDSTFIAVAGEGRGLYASAINLEGRLLGEFAGPTKSCSTVAINSGGGRIAVGCDDFSVSLFSGPPFRLLKTLRDHHRFVSAVRFHPDGERLATAGADGKIFLYNAEGEEHNQAKEVTAHCSTTLKVSITGLEWDGEALITCSTDGIIRQWNLSNKACKASEPFGQQILGIKCQNDNLTAILLDGTILVMDKNNFNIKSRHIGHTKTISAIRIEDGKIKYSADLGGRIVDWSNNTFTASNNDEYGISSILEVDGKLLTASGLVNKIYDITEKREFTITSGSIGQFLVNGHLTIVSPKSISVLDHHSGALKATLSHTDETICAVISNTDLYYANVDKTVKKVKVTGQSAEIVDTFDLKTITGRITAIAVHGDLLAVGDDQRRIYLFNLSTRSVFINNLSP